MKAFALIASATVGLSACSRMPAQSPITPGVAELEFIKACQGVDEYEKTRASIKADGWAPVIAEDGSDLDNVMNKLVFIKGRRSIRNMVTYPYAKTVDGRPFHIILSTLTRRGQPYQTGCYMFNFEAGHDLVNPDPEGHIGEWLSSYEFLSGNIDGQVNKKIWNQVDGQGVYRVQVQAVSAADTREVYAEAGYSGRMWSIIAFEKPAPIETPTQDE